MPSPAGLRLWAPYRLLQDWSAEGQAADEPWSAAWVCVSQDLLFAQLLPRSADLIGRLGVERGLPPSLLLYGILITIWFDAAGLYSRYSTEDVFWLACFLVHCSGVLGMLWSASSWANDFGDDRGFFHGLLLARAAQVVVVLKIAWYVPRARKPLIRQWWSHGVALGCYALGHVYASGLAWAMGVVVDQFLPTWGVLALDRAGPLQNQRWTWLFPCVSCVDGRSADDSRAVPLNLQYFLGRCNGILRMLFALAFAGVVTSVDPRRVDALLCMLTLACLATVYFNSLNTDVPTHPMHRSQQHAIIYVHVLTALGLATVLFGVGIRLKVVLFRDVATCHALLVVGFTSCLALIYAERGLHPTELRTHCCRKLIRGLCIFVPLMSSCMSLFKHTFDVDLDLDVATLLCSCSALALLADVKMCLAPEPSPPPSIRNDFPGISARAHGVEQSWISRVDDGSTGSFMDDGSSVELGLSGVESYPRYPKLDQSPRDNFLEFKGYR